MTIIIHRRSAHKRSALEIISLKRYVSSAIHREYADGYDKPIPVYPASSLGSFKGDVANAPRSFVDDRYGFRDERACRDILWDL